ncbi:MAG: fatty acid desaturase [Planctomycetia bacterium]|nr:fatty acid desaturase [Planctomycetia bacterium]
MILPDPIGPRPDCAVAQVEIEPLSGNRLATPAETQPLKIAWGHAISIVAVHLLALLALLPWLFSWTGLILAIAGFFVYGLLGINLCYHRILTHRGVTLPKWLEHTFATLGVCCLQDSPARWVAVHRMHHQHSDEQSDPHTPLVHFLWSHIGWLFVEHRQHSRYFFYEHYARDILRDPFYLRFEKNLFWLWTYVIHAALYFLAGLAIGWWSTGEALAGVQFGASLLVWGVFVRTVVEWHNTWAVNSVTHLWGYRNYETGDDSRNHWLVALTAHGEGWHNNHHADQRSARHGHRWWEYDLTWLTIRLLEIVGLATHVARPRLAPVATAASRLVQPLLDLQAQSSAELEADRLSGKTPAL